MPPRQKKATAGQLELSGATSVKDIETLLWKAADKLRGSMDPYRYKDLVLGLIFLKYLSDAFEERRDQLVQELTEEGLDEEALKEFLESQDEYTRVNVYWVPDVARWNSIAARAKSEGIGQLLDEAMDALMRENAALTGVLPKIFNRDNVDQRRLGELVDLLSDARFTGDGERRAQDVLGAVYEYFLGNFGRAAGKEAGSFYTPRSVVELLVEVLEPYKGQVYDPCCGSGGMFVQAGKFVEAHRDLVGNGDKLDLSIYGQESNDDTWRLAKMNLAIHGIDGNLAARWGDTFADDKHPDLKADFVLANPPFNIKDWHRVETDPRWKYGVPPKNNANYAWLQHIISKLGERGTAGVVLANGSMSSQTSGEGDIRKAMVDADLVACMVALPSQLFRTTQIPACLWFLSKDKSPQGARRLEDRRGEILFIDAREMGEMADRTERVLRPDDIAKIAGTYHAWRGTKSARDAGMAYEDVAGFCVSADLETLRANGYVLTPGRYVGAAKAEQEDPEVVAERIKTLTGELYELFDKSDELAKAVREQLGSIDV